MTVRKGDYVTGPLDYTDFTNNNRLGCHNVCHTEVSHCVTATYSYERACMLHINNPENPCGHINMCEVGLKDWGVTLCAKLKCHTV